MKNPLPFLAMHFYVQCMVAPTFMLYTLISGKTSAYHLVQHLCEVLNIQFVKTKDSAKLEAGSVFLCNHRSWADFFVDQTLCGGGAYLSRMMVWIGTPVTSLWAWLSHSTWFFNRKPGIDRSAFGKWIDSQFDQRPHPGLIAYPEGTRNQKNEPLKLKSGVLQYAYEFNRPIQCVITTNKDTVVNEKAAKLNRNVICVTHISKAIYPKDFADSKEFVTSARELFVKTWEKAYNTKPEDGELYSPPYGLKAPKYDDVPIKRRLWILRMLVFLLFIFYMYQKRKVSLVSA